MTGHINEFNPWIIGFQLSHGNKIIAIMVLLGITGYLSAPGPDNNIDIGIVCSSPR